MCAVEMSYFTKITCCFVVDEGRARVTGPTCNIIYAPADSNRRSMLLSGSYRIRDRTQSNSTLTARLTTKHEDKVIPSSHIIGRTTYPQPLIIGGRNSNPVYVGLYGPRQQESQISCIQISRSFCWRFRGPLETVST